MEEEWRQLRKEAKIWNITPEQVYEMEMELKRDILLSGKKTRSYSREMRT
jgi:hypothetical protein